MSSYVLYYSNHCEHSRELLQHIAGSNLAQNPSVHYVCIDRRAKGEDGRTFVQLDSGQNLVMPPTVTGVPALMNVSGGFGVVYEGDIYTELKKVRSTSQAPPPRPVAGPPVPLAPAAAPAAVAEPYRGAQPQPQSHSSLVGASGNNNGDGPWGDSYGSFV
jgi:hypothetical protein